MVRFVAVEYLEEDGFHAVEASDAREAIELLQSGAVPVDVVFSDIQMPGGLDGCDLARWIYLNRPDLPVILTSGRIQDEALPTDLRGLAPIEPKPYKVKALMQRVRAAAGC